MDRVGQSCQKAAIDQRGGAAGPGIEDGHGFTRSASGNGCGNTGQGALDHDRFTAGQRLGGAFAAEGQMMSHQAGRAQDAAAGGMSRNTGEADRPVTDATGAHAASRRTEGAGGVTGPDFAVQRLRNARPVFRQRRRIAQQAPGHWREHQPGR